MKNIGQELEFLKALMAGVSGIFGDKCEVVLHDLTQGYDSTIVEITNGHVTNRRVGDCGSNLGLEVLRGTDAKGDKFGYLTNTKDGKLLRSSSVYIRDDDDKVVGCLCINFDVSELSLANNVISSMLGNSQTGEKTNGDEEFFVNNVNELSDALLQRIQEEIGKPVSYMTREEKIRAIAFLDKRGAFLVTKAGNRICQYFDISKFTLYSYLDEIHSGGNVGV